ncbi:MAG TPA: ankyrin repeat domain-containing protein [Gemmatimonadaceae bacterium]|jgi:ankyrin repeat protein
MSSEFRRALPEHADLDQQRKLAKELIAAYRRGDDTARARVRAALPNKTRVVLADAQFVLAREYGFESWNALKEHIEAKSRGAHSPIESFKSAVTRGSVPVVFMLLERYAEVRAAISEPIFGFDAPALNVVGDDLEMADALLDWGADPNRKSDWWAGGFHPLHVVSPRVAERLLDAGSIPDACAAAHMDRLDLLKRIIAEDPSRVHELGGDGQRPLHFARSREVVDFLLESGADIDARDVDHRSTAAEHMIGSSDDPAKSRNSLARYLVDRGASVDIFLAAALGLADRAREMVTRDPSLLRLRTGQGEYAEKKPSSYHIYLWTIGSNLTPLETADRFRQFETLEALLSLASPEQRLLLACHQGAGDKARAIVRENPDIVAALSGADRRALTDEAWNANAPAVKLMMELGFDPSAPAVTGPTGGNALHCAAWEGSVECVAALLDHPSGRALINSREDTYGGTPLSWCCHGSTNCGRRDANHAEVARVLLAAGARPNAPLTDCSEEMQAVLEGSEFRPVIFRREI